MAAKTIGDMIEETTPDSASVIEIETPAENSRKLSLENARKYPLGEGPVVGEGSDACMGAATLVAGTVTVNTTAVTANSRIFLSGQNSSGTHGELTVSARSAGTSFTITSSSGTDTRSVAWLIFEPLV